ncbi:MAG: hypothetical protein IJ223_04895 [Clostridia bacterium]|nr:hypothetical protein [Clostridia bacterium]
MVIKGVDFRIFSVPYKMNCELEVGLQEKLLALSAETGCDVETFSVIRDEVNPNEEDGRVTTFLVVFKPFKV